jgi:hypothetical protein
MHPGPFACHASIDRSAANPGKTGQLPAFSHLHAALRTPDRTRGCLAATRFCIVSVLARPARIIHVEDIL